MGKRSNGEGTIAKMGNRYRARYWDPTISKQRAVYGATKEECAKKLREATEAIRKGVFVAPEKITTGDWFDYWFENYYCVNTKQSTQATTHQGIRTHIKPVIGTIPLQKLTTEHLQKCIRTMQENGLCANTIRRNFKTIKQCLHQAVVTNKIPRNPADNAILPESKKHEINHFTGEELKLLLQNLPDNTHGNVIRFLLGTGMRVSEACGLKWNDIQPNGIHIERINMTIKDWREEGYINTETCPKTTAGKRVIPTTEALKQILREQKVIQHIEKLKAGSAWCGDYDNDYVFANALGKPADKNNIARTLRMICKKAGIPSRGPHTLRHTFATNWIQKSSDIASLSRILGHSDTGFTYSTYCHADTKEMEKGMLMMESLIHIG